MRGMPGLLLELTKARITVFVTLSVATGYLLFQGRLDLGILLPAGGVFLLACGSAALNQVQERRIDARMRRTRDRPVPSGRIAPEWALFVAVVFIGGGLSVLSLVERHTLVVLALGALSLVWYNGVYLLLKRVTAFAVVPGALVGAIPPVIGWCAAGGVAHDAAILEVAFFFFLWQIPHFWLLSLLYGKEYEEAGLPSPTKHLAPRQFQRVTFVWIAALAATGLALAASRPIGIPWNLLVLAASLWLVLSSLGLLRGPGSRKLTTLAFLRLNTYALIVMVLLSASAVVG